MMKSDQTYEQAIILDFEMNPVTKENNTALANEIIEIGAVKVVNNSEITDRFQSYVKPVFSNTLSPIIRRLTGIDESNLRHAPTFIFAIHTFSEWIGNRKTKIYAWSESDYQQFQTECNEKEMNPPDNMNEWEDLQNIYFKKLGADITREKTALKKAAEQNGIVIDKHLIHSASYDAYITTQIYLLLSTGRFQKQASLLREAHNTNRSSAPLLLGEMCKSFFEQNMDFT